MTFNAVEGLSTTYGSTNRHLSVVNNPNCKRRELCNLVFRTLMAIVCFRELTRNNSKLQEVVSLSFTLMTE